MCWLCFNLEFLVTWWGMKGEEAYRHKLQCNYACLESHFAWLVEDKDVKELQCELRLPRPHSLKSTSIYKGWQLACEGGMHTWKDTSCSNSVNLLINGE